MNFAPPNSTVVGVSDLSAPSAIMARLEEIEGDLAIRQNALEDAARKWFKAKRDRDKARAVAFLGAEGTVAERQAKADLATATDGRDEEAEWEALRAVVRTLETRATIGMALLKTHTRTAMSSADFDGGWQRRAA